MPYRTRPTHAQVSGPYASLNGCAVTWLESYDSLNWHPKSGKIIVVGQRDQALYVESEGTRYWVKADPQRYKDIVVQEKER